MAVGYLDQPFVIENRPGASGNIAARGRQGAAGWLHPDAGRLAEPGQRRALPTHYFDLVRDIEPVAGLTRQPNVMVVNPSLPPRTVPEFVAYAKANAGKINMASTGSGTPSHVAGELFKMMTGAP